MREGRRQPRFFEAVRDIKVGIEERGGLRQTLRRGKDGVLLASSLGFQIGGPLGFNVTVLTDNPVLGVAIMTGFTFTGTTIATAAELHAIRNEGKEERRRRDRGDTLAV